MSKQMTPCEKLGYKVGDKFKASKSGAWFNVGEEVELGRDDGSNYPYFFNARMPKDSDGGWPRHIESVEKISNAKLKPAKQALADAINQNGGWRSGANWACQHGSNRMFVFSASGLAPTRNAVRGMACWNSGATFFGGFKFDRKLPNWHQCVLSREEYYHAYPKTDDDGWIEWNGGECPVDNDSLVDVKFPDGSEYFNTDSYWDWSSESDTPISHYRQSKKVVKPWICESVTRSIPEPEAKPTIEQLAQDYRNKLDFANSKQQEADDAKVAADAALGELERAGEAIGLLIGIAKSDQEPELVITDWRDLLVNDVIFVGEHDEHKSGEYVVVWLEDSDYDGDFAVIVVGVDGIERCMDTAMEWRFISRP